MKKFLTIVFLFGMFFSAYAQNSYVTVYTSQNVDYASAGHTKEYINLSGAIPSTMKRTYEYYYDFNKYFGYQCIGDVLNLLADNGFTVEQMNSVCNEYGNVFTTYLLSKSSNGSNSSNVIPRVQADPDEEVTEVARYNLQGMPISESEKGVQIYRRVG